MILKDFLKIKCQRCKRSVPIEEIDGTLCRSCQSALERIKFRQNTIKDYKKRYDRP